MVRSFRTITAEVRNIQDKQWQSDVKQMNSLNRFVARVSTLYDRTMLLKKEAMRSENNLRDLIREARTTYNRVDLILCRPDIKQLRCLAEPQFRY